MHFHRSRQKSTPSKTTATKNSPMSTSKMDASIGLWILPRTILLKILKKRMRDSIKFMCCRRQDRRQADVHRTSAFRWVRIPISAIKKYRYPKGICIFWQRMRDSNCVFLVYMVFLKLLCSQNVAFISVIPLFPTVLFKQIL